MVRLNKVPLGTLTLAYADARAAAPDARPAAGGAASQLPLLAALHDRLLAPFEPGSDLASEPRAEPGTSIGYLELLPALWDAERSILAVLGSTPQGLQWAGAALLTPELRGRRAGNFAAIIGTQIEAGVAAAGACPLGLKASAMGTKPAAAG